jgi:hypothetical protein
MTDLTVANIIKDQLGGKALFMIGAKNFSGTDDSLSFRIGRNNKKINYIKITLNGLDQYDVEYGYIRAMKYTVREIDSNLYVDMLHGSIERATGLYTHL